TNEIIGVSCVCGNPTRVFAWLRVGRCFIAPECLNLYYQLVRTHEPSPKYQLIRQSLADAIASGEYQPGQRLPSESELVKAFAASRPTVNRALRELQLSGVIERRAGSGSYVRADTAARGYTFGLLIPELGRTEIFEPICRGMAEAQHGSQHVLLWGSSFGDAANIEQQASQACRQLIAKKVSGVFFAPLELTPQKDAINRSVSESLDKAGIPVVLLDRDLVSYPERSQYDLVGIDNQRAGYVVTRHLIAGGCRKIVFLGRPGSAPTVDARIAGYEGAIAESKQAGGPQVLRMDPEDRTEVKKILARLRPDAFVCANDFTAAHLLKTLIDLKIDVPGGVRMVGIDDVKYASLLSVPLTTIHQPCASIGAIAVGAMLDRLRDPKLPARDILLNFHLVVRESCGAGKKQMKRAV
ncbi:MAG TPA: GntR family transcriptional regulator, partial [Terriglobia bacterium]|nr:GntR family transcriptional regulator [Terriglobia bacterium]